MPLFIAFEKRKLRLVGFAFRSVAVCLSSPASSVFRAGAWVLAALTLALPAWGLDPAKSLFQYNCQSWARLSGLPANKITSIAQTRDGMMWFATQNGLLRFDGREFKLVPVDLAEARTQDVRTIVAVKQGGLLFATNNGGFGYYDGRVFSVLADERWSQPTASALTVFESRDGVIWTGQQPGWGRWVPGKPRDSVIEIEDPTTLCFCEDRSGRVWRGTVYKGVECWVDGHWRSLPDEGLKKRNIHALAFDSKGDLWVGTEVALRHYDAEGQLKEVIAEVGAVEALIVDAQDTVWIGTRGSGLVRLRKGALQYFKKADGLVSDFVSALFEDQEGSLWVGTSDGLSQVTDVKFPIFTNREGFPAGSARTVSPARSGGVWIYGMGLSRFDGENLRVYLDELAPLNRYLIAGVETTKGELYLIDGDRTVGVWSEGKVIARHECSTWPRGLAEDSHGVLVGVGGVLCRVSKERIQTYDFSGPEPPAFHWINNLSTCRDGSVLVSSNNGLFRVKDGAYQQWSTPQGLLGAKVFWAHEDVDGAVWVGMPTGIARIKDGAVVNLTQEQGLFDNRTYAIVADDHGYFWICSGHGIYRVGRDQLSALADRKIGRVECDVFDGFNDIKFVDRTDEEPSGCKTADGRIWFPSSQGAVMIDPAHYVRNTRPPPVHIERTQLDGVDLKATSGARLEPGRRRLEFTFNALSYIAPRKMRIQYQLEGRDSGWTEAGDRRSVVYSDLPPGKYIFRVQACNADGVWNTEGASFAFEQTPHFYATIWFRGAGLLAGAFLLWGGYRWKVRLMELSQKKLRAHNDLLEAKVAARTAALAREHALLRALLDSSSDQIYFKDAQSRYLKASKARADALGARSPETLVGKTDLEFFGAAYGQAEYNDEQEIIRTGQPIIGKIEKQVWPDGRVTWAITSKMPLRDDENRIVGTFGTSKNITEIKEAEAKLEQVHKALLDASREAGMAEVATSVLHNVGNVLNSVNVSATVVAERIRNSRLSNLAKAGEMLAERKADLAQFLVNDPRGQRLPDYLANLADNLIAEQRAVLEELSTLCKNVEHIKEIVAMQQSYAKVSGLTEVLSVVDLVEDALRMHAASFGRRDVVVVRQYSAKPTLTLEKHKMLQILVNLLKNAGEACERSGRPDKRVSVSVSEAAGRVRISVADNGVGISPENLTRIFAHGFTTRREGHGFGLHSGANAAKELGGSLIATSEGVGKGAVFVLELPLERYASSAETSRTQAPLAT